MHNFALLFTQFLLVLFAAMASFAQMWVSFTFEPNQSESQYYLEGYLKAYTMMVKFDMFSCLYTLDVFMLNITIDFTILRPL